MVSAEEGNGTNMEPSKKTKDRAVGEWSGHRCGFPEGCAHLATVPVSGLPTCGRIPHYSTSGQEESHMISSKLTGCVCGV